WLSVVRRRGGRWQRARSSLIGYGDSDFSFQLRRPIRKPAIGSQHSSDDLRNSAGRTAVTSASNIDLAGVTPRACDSLQESYWNCNLTQFSLRPRCPLPPLATKPPPYH